MKAQLMYCAHHTHLFCYVALMHVVHVIDINIVPLFNHIP